MSAASRTYPQRPSLRVPARRQAPAPLSGVGRARKHPRGLRPVAISPSGNGSLIDGVIGGSRFEYQGRAQAALPPV
jgi:hypothetical protein